MPEVGLTCTHPLGHDDYHDAISGGVLHTWPDPPRRPVTDDPVNHPQHYQWLPVEAIQITEHFGFCLGNALKYILRADRKGRPLEDLRKAEWYLKREIANREKSLGESS